AVEIGFLDQHASRLRALVPGDDAAPFEHVDQTSRPCVADPEPPLNQRYRRGLRLHHDLDRLVEQRILVWIELPVVVRLVLERSLGGLEERLVELLAALGAALLE